MAGLRVPRLDWLEIRKYGDVVAGQRIQFNESFNVFLGQNATGKTTLLNLISNCLGFNRIEDEFNVKYKIMLDIAELTVEITSTRLDKTTFQNLPQNLPGFESQQKFEIQSESEIKWRNGYVLRVEQNTQSITGLHKNTKIFEIPTSINLGMPWSLTSLIGAISFQNTSEIGILKDSLIALFTSFAIGFRSVSRFDESLDNFQALTSKLYSENTPVLYVHKINNTWFPSALNLPVRGNDYGKMLATVNTEGISDLKFSKSDFEFLDPLASILNFSSIDCHLRAMEKKVGEFESYQFRGLTFWFTKHDGSTYRHEQLSYGQKRLLAFFYYLELNPHIAIADELVNGLHHGWIKACMDQLATRQSFLTSQNPLLLDFMSFRSVKDAKSSFIVCRQVESKTNDGRTVSKFSWENLSKEEAQGFYDAYKVGIEHVGEILRMRGLW